MLIGACEVCIINKESTSYLESSYFANATHSEKNIGGVDPTPGCGWTMSSSDDAKDVKPDVKPEAGATADLKLRRRGQRSAVTRLIGRLNRSVVEEDYDQIRTYLDKVKISFNKLETVHDEYMNSNTVADEDTVETDENWFHDVENNYISAVKDAKAFLKDSSKDKTDLNASNLKSLMHLPRVQLDPFDGSASDYQSFIAIFDEMVHNTEDDDQVKLTRLLQYTTGPAKASIKNTAIVGGSEGYQKAREILKNRFGDKHLVSQTIINDLKFGNPVQKPVELQQLADDLQMALSSLTKLEMVKEIENQNSFHEILNRCKSHISDKWRRKAIKHKRSKKSYPWF